MVLHSVIKWRDIHQIWVGSLSRLNDGPPHLQPQPSPSPAHCQTICNTEFNNSGSDVACLSWASSSTRQGRCSSPMDPTQPQVGLVSISVFIPRGALIPPPLDFHIPAVIHCLKNSEWVVQKFRGEGFFFYKKLSTYSNPEISSPSHQD